ncbi:uracil-DNA glycosylase family protein [Algoriphagus terrigena]|uniref:uracil-DNA glycosylase family protein n=1 Tax=Algoriphagus terrigena TaxID=344884 RepID=UPI000410F489|nr:uracil-DNA glycosylase family protein [Algoriphagus terrigena]
MTKIETHPFEPFCPDDASSLILGSFPCFNGLDYGDWFYCGSGKNELWRLLSDTFGMPVQTLEQKRDLCIQNRLALSDVAYKVIRTKNNCSDVNLKIVEHNKAGILQCLTPTIGRVLFTSRFVEKHFKKMFPDFTLPTEVLLSPSPAANTYIASLSDYKDKRLGGVIGSIYEYRLADYRRKLGAKNLQNIHPDEYSRQ